VRVTAAPFVAFDFLAPFSGFVAQKHPGLRLEVLSSIQYLDLARGEADLALRPRAPQNADLTLVHTLHLDNAVFVSRELKARLPKKPKPSELPWVAWSKPYDLVPPNPQLEAMIPNFEPAFTADHYLVMLAAAHAGVGAIVLARVHHRFSRDSPLVPLDLDLGPHARSELHLVAPKSALDIPRVRRVAELIVSELKATRRK
jgi:DNA-binding transcriptional LysR family regulator